MIGITKNEISDLGWHKIPSEIQMAIAGKLTFKEYIALRLVSKNLKSLTDADTVNWSKLFKKRLAPLDQIMMSIRPLENFALDPERGIEPSYFKIYSLIRELFFQYHPFNAAQSKYEGQVHQLTSASWPSTQTKDLFFIDGKGAIFRVSDSIYRMDGVFKDPELFFQLEDGQRATSLCPFPEGLFVGTACGKIYFLECKEGKIDSTLIYQNENARAILSIQQTSIKKKFGLIVTLLKAELEKLCYFFIVDTSQTEKKVERISMGNHFVVSTPQFGAGHFLLKALLGGGLQINDFEILCNRKTKECAAVTTILTSYVIRRFCFVGEHLIFYTTMGEVGALDKSDFSLGEKGVRWFSFNVSEAITEIGPIGSIGFYIKTASGNNWTGVFKEDGACIFTQQMKELADLVWIPDMGFFFSKKEGGIWFQQPSLSLRNILGKLI